ncbi:MAG TPA: SRPBCC domain-containing protein [Acidimicrobiia bacterium]|nr:SRPBCC domain-containing protein [Acidimicrobiia bacterium]
MSTETIPAVLRAVDVSIAPERAFEVFTRRMGDWWPLRTHSIAEDRAVGVRFEEWVGGKVFEVVDDGTEWEWAEVLAWEPPHRLVLAWHPTPEPIVSTEVEIRFNAVEGGTRVELEHRGWERLGELGITARIDYDQGWLPVLTLYQTLANG